MKLSNRGPAEIRLACCGSVPCASPLLALLLVCAGCAVDERSLSAASTTGASAGSGAGGSAGHTSASNNGQVEMAGEASLPHCVYVGEIAPECDTLVRNAGFESDADGWEPEGGVYKTWREKDASEATGSGSVDVLNLLHGEAGGVAPGSARQCLPATPGQTYDVAGDTFIEDGQGDGLKGGPYEGVAMLEVYFFDDNVCEGTSIGFLDSEHVTAVEEWTHVSASGVAPELTRAMSIRLNTIKPIREYQFTAAFDNVFVRER